MKYNSETFYLAVKQGDLEDVRNHLRAGIDPYTWNPFRERQPLEAALLEVIKAETPEAGQEDPGKVDNAVAIFHEMLDATKEENRRVQLMFYITNSRATRFTSFADESTIRELAKDPETVFTVVSNGYDHTLKLLVEHGADVNAMYNGKVLLHCAAYAPGVHEGQKTVNCVKILLDAGANPNAEDERGNTSLFFARDEQVVIELLQRGVDIRHLNKNGQGVLAAQVEHNPSHTGATLYLIEAGAGFEGLDMENSPLNTDVGKVVAAAWKKQKLGEIVREQTRPGKARPAF